MKFLCVCQGGTVRSAALAWLLKYHHGHDAIAASAERNSPDTLAMLVDWADRVVLMSKEIERWFPSDLLASPKVGMMDVGADVYGTPFHPQLQAMLSHACERWAARGWDRADFTFTIA